MSMLTCCHSERLWRTTHAASARQDHQLLIPARTGSTTHTYTLHAHTHWQCIFACALDHAHEARKNEDGTPLFHAHYSQTWDVQWRSLACTMSANSCTFPTAIGVMACVTPSHNLACTIKEPEAKLRPPHLHCTSAMPCDMLLHWRGLCGETVCAHPHLHCTSSSNSVCFLASRLFCASSAATARAFS